jgi:peptidyl-prolyl cis-trans isomerase C
MLTKRNLFVCLVITALWVCVSIPWAQAEETKSTKEEVAEVNGTIITRGDLDREMLVVKKRFGRMGKSISGDQLSQLEGNVLDSLIGRELLYQDAQKNGIHIGDEAIDKQLETLKKRFPQEKDFKNAMQKMHLSEQDVRGQIRQGMTIQKFVETKFVNQISIGEKETRAYYDGHQAMFKRPEEVRASHILIKLDSKADEKTKLAARQKLEGIQKELLGGADFGELAKKYSEGPSAAKGGDLGFFRRGQMVPPFEKVAFALKPGEVSDIVVTRFGYHLVKVTDKKPEKTLAYAEVKDSLSRFLKDQEVGKAIDAHVQDLKKVAKVKRFLAVQP